MAPRKPKPQDSAGRVDPAECAGAKELTSTLSALLQLDISSACVVPDLLLPQLVKLAELIRQASLLGLWETSKKRLPLALSNICDWALLQAATPFDIVGGAAAVFCLCLVTIEKQYPKDETAAHQVLVKELLRLDIPSKLFRAALAAHERACERSCIAHDMDPPSAATLASGSTCASVASGDMGSKPWAIKLASSVAGATQACFNSNLDVHEQLQEQCRCGQGGASLFCKSIIFSYIILQCQTHFEHCTLQEPRFCAVHGTALWAGV